MTEEQRTEIKAVLAQFFAGKISLLELVRQTEPGLDWRVEDKFYVSGALDAAVAWYRQQIQALPPVDDKSFWAHYVRESSKGSEGE